MNSDVTKPLQTTCRRRLSSRTRIVKNICSFICMRPMGSFPNVAGNIYRENMKILRKIVCQKDTVFQNVWTKHSKSAIAYDDGRIYFDNYRCCFTSIPAKPQQLYEMAKCSKLEKIQDALLCQCPVGKLLPSASDCTPSLITVTGHNWLLRLSADTAATLQKIYLGSYTKFRYVNWDVPQESIVLKSAQQKPAPAARQSGSQRSVLLYLAVFRVLPLSLVGILEIDRRIFGSSITDAMVSHGMLVVMHSAGLVRLYSFERIAEQYMQQKLVLGQACNWKSDKGTVGEFPFGIPCNITLTECPTLLFEVPCLDNSFEVGGYPWHYIITPNKKNKRGAYHIRSMDDHSLAKNGIQDMKCCSLEIDWILFHADESGRIIHMGPNRINVLRLEETHNDSYQRQVIEDFVILASRDSNVNNLVTVTASGRLVKKRFNQLDDDPEQETFKILDYEDELDLLSVVAVTQIEEEGKAHVDLHCNKTGTLLKKITLQESWDVRHSDTYRRKTQPQLFLLRLQNAV
ncbi:DDB1- and CUL4-associated factor 17 isoform X2 [Ascaphus truei]|uniref:DDB1- and CUL4-associated factor 17 isoform X2 n=1 Tax=Ascaphus truei TaxID=8439 RepID=UPI003F59B0AD